MTRIQLLIPLMMWGIFETYQPPLLMNPYSGSCYYLITLLLIVMLVRLLVRRTMRKSSLNADRAAARFHQMLFAIRWLILAIHLVGLIWLGWGALIQYYDIKLGSPLKFFLSLISSLPVFISWIGLMWAQYPLDRAVREQNATVQFELGEKIFSPPSLAQYLDIGIRLQLLTLLVPIAFALLLRDILSKLFSHTFIGRNDPESITAILISVAIAMIIGPVIIRLVLPVTSLPDCELRDGLEAMAKRLGLRYCDILLWNTHFGIGNAAVMGFFPQVRYILLSDMLVESLSKPQIEAVFAHEIGHVKHHHMFWYVTFFIVLLLWLGNAANLIAPYLPEWIPQDLVFTFTGLLIFFVAFGLLSRSFERQADVYAARNVIEKPAEDSPIHENGVIAFNSALATVARINHMPLDHLQMTRGKNLLARLYLMIVFHAGAWMHGSIRSRMDFLQFLYGRPEQEARFDRGMLIIRCGLILALIASGTWLAISLTK